MLKTSVPSYFKSRRDRLMKANPGAAFIVPAAREQVRNHDVHYPFRQDSNFQYLTGMEEPDAFLILVPAGSAAGDYRTVLFVRERNQEREIWDGERYGPEGAMNVFGADEAFTVDQLEAKLPQLLSGAERVFYRIGRDETTDRRVFGILQNFVRTLGRSGRGLPPIFDPTEALGEMRLFKGPEEVELLRKAGSATARAHRQIMQEVRPGMNEADVESLIDYLFRKNGCKRGGYGSIVAGGKNATCLHYVVNNEELRDGDLLLIDAGGEYDYYTADITRTFPVGKDYTPAQARIYDVVLNAKREAMKLAKPGTKYTDIHKRAVDALVDGLMSLGLLKGDRGEIMKSGAFRRFYPHSTGHWLGIDVHDQGLYTEGHTAEPRILKPGMCFTIEPGLYCQPNDLDCPEVYRGIGVRIEDDILITENGHENLTAEVPEDRTEIVKLRSGA